MSGDQVAHKFNLGNINIVRHSNLAGILPNQSRVILIHSCIDWYTKCHNFFVQTLVTINTRAVGRGVAAYWCEGVRWTRVCKRSVDTHVVDGARQTSCAVADGSYRTG
jgi:hypothetical protein